MFLEQMSYGNDVYYVFCLSSKIKHCNVVANILKQTEMVLVKTKSELC